MSHHNNPKYQIPALIESLKAHGLETDEPSQLSDAFRFGYLAAVEASARQLAEQPGFVLIAAERWAQLEHMWSRNATPETIASYIGRPEILDRISKIRREHEAAVQGNAA